VQHGAHQGGQKKEKDSQLSLTFGVIQAGGVLEGAAVSGAEFEEEEEELVEAGYGTALLLGPDLDDDDEGDASFQGGIAFSCGCSSLTPVAATGGHDEDEEFLSDELDPEDPEGDEPVLPPGKKRDRATFNQDDAGKPGDGSDEDN
jgi:hypothetical protein